MENVVAAMLVVVAATVVPELARVMLSTTHTMRLGLFDTTLM